MSCAVLPGLALAMSAVWAVLPPVAIIVNGAARPLTRHGLTGSRRGSGRDGVGHCSGDVAWWWVWPVGGANG